MMRCLLQNRACVFFSSGRSPSLPFSHRPSVAVVLLRLLSALYSRSLLLLLFCCCWPCVTFLRVRFEKQMERDRVERRDAPTVLGFSITVVTEKYRSHVFPMADHVLVEISVTRILGVDSWRERYVRGCCVPLKYTRLATLRYILFDGEISRVTVLHRRRDETERFFL